MVEVSVSMLDRVASVAAPDGSGREAAETGTVWSEAILTGKDAAVIVTGKQRFQLKALP